MAKTAQGIAQCCIWHETHPECCIFRTARVCGALTGLLFTVGGDQLTISSRFRHNQGVFIVQRSID